MLCQLIDVETLLQNFVWKLAVEKFAETDCSTAGKASVRGKKLRIGDDNVSWDY